MAGEGHLLEVNHEMCESHSLPFKLLGAQVSWVDSEPRLSLLHPGRRGGGWVGGGRLGAGKEKARRQIQLVSQKAKLCREM